MAGLTDALAARLATRRVQVETGTRVHDLEVRDGRLTGEVLGTVVDRARKAELLAEIAAREGVPLSQTVAVGDGANDLDMLAQAGTAVVVEDAPAEVLALADHIIAGPSTAGLVRGLADLGLIAPS